MNPSYERLKQDVSRIAIKCGRNPDDITIVAVSKNASLG